MYTNFVQEFLGIIGFIWRNLVYIFSYIIVISLLLYIIYSNFIKREITGYWYYPNFITKFFYPDYPAETFTIRGKAAVVMGIFVLILLVVSIWTTIKHKQKLEQDRLYILETCKAIGCDQGTLKLLEK